MKNFIQYHNTDKIGYSASELDEPKIFTNKSVRNLSSGRVWLISSEGKFPKSYFLAAVFDVKRTATGTYEHEAFKNAAFGTGHVIGEHICLNGTALIRDIREVSCNFKNGLTAIKDKNMVAELEKLSADYLL